MTMPIIDLIICTVTVLGIIFGLLTITLSYLNKKRFIKVCVLYEKEFGSLPLSVQIFSESDMVGFSEGYAMKIQFIINPIIFGKKSAHSKFNDVEFMRALPSNIKNGLLLSIFYQSLVLLYSLFLVFVFILSNEFFLNDLF